MTRHCAKCRRMVPQHHQHLGRADYFIPAPGAAYHCTWCRQALASNEALCKCPGAKKARCE
jgi:hypothetical protein